MDPESAVRRAVCAALAVLALLLAACSPGDNYRDLKGTPSHDPDWSVVINNVDKNPNIMILCTQGLGFYTTTRDYNAIARLPEMDAFCKTKGQPGEGGK